MSYIEIILLGLVQGLTEFFPVSSSGHLLISKILFNIEDSSLLFDIVLHLGTLVSIIIFWKNDIISEFKDVNFLSKIFIACIPAGIIGLCFKEFIQSFFFIINDYSIFPKFLIINYLIMGLLIYITKYYHNNDKKELTYKVAICIGIAQVFALMPGISRSGITIIMALILGCDFKTSFKFSFYLSIPIIFFAGLESLFSSYRLLSLDNGLILIFGFISSAVFGYIILGILSLIIQKQKYWYFSFYCLFTSIILMVYNYGF